MSIKSKVDPSKLQGGQGGHGDKGEKDEKGKAQLPKIAPAAALATSADVEAQVKAVGEDIRNLKDKLKIEGITGKKLNEHPEIKGLVEKLQELKAHMAAAGSKPTAASSGAALPEQQAAAPAAPKVEAAKPKAAAGKPSERPVDDITRLNFRIGRIQKVWPHPNADKLYFEEIDLGETTGPRTIASGLRDHLKPEDMDGKLVVVLANLKPRKMQGFESQGMVMCATKDGKTTLLQPPAGAVVGERVAIEGVEMADPDDKLNEKSGKAPWPAVEPGLVTDATKQATFKGAVMRVAAGPIIATAADGKIS